MTSSSIKFENVVSFGCSFARGEELKDRSKKYASQVAERYGAGLADYSIPGTSNEMISQLGVNLLLEKKHKYEPSKTLVLVEWTFCNRLNFCGKKNKYYVIANYNLEAKTRKFKLLHGHDHLHFNDDFEDLLDLKFYYDHHTNLTHMLYNMARNIHHLQTFLKLNGYNYIFLFASDYEKEIITSLDKGFDITGLVDMSFWDTYPNFRHTINDIDNSHICPTSFLGFANKIKCKFGKWLHPLEDGHVQFSKVLIDFIESKYGEQ